jgi:type IV secretory pathway TrbF-like protein
LTEAEALVALIGKMRELVGQTVQISGLERASQTSFRARADWTRPGTTSGTSKCTALLTVTLRGPGVIELSVLVVDCNPPAGQVTPPIYK